MTTLTQRDVMRLLYVRHKGDEKLIIREYAKAELDGKTHRMRNSKSLSPEDYADRLLNDGLKKGWIYGG